MPRLTEPAAVRAILETDRCWSAYALGDLAPGFWERSTWFASSRPVPALILLFRGFTPPVLFTLGPAEELLDEIATEAELNLMVPPTMIRPLEKRYRLTNLTALWRMVLEPARFRATLSPGAVRLGLADVEAIRHLYGDGKGTGEAPQCFAPSMVTEGVFFGIREGEALVAVAGTHLVVPAEGVGAIGNIYTRRDRRGRGLGAAVTSAVTAELLGRGLPTIVLNVVQTNAVAVRLYRRLGFTIHAAFCEGLATRRETSAGGHL
jgi:ribosomal protein S18 acetylase RimI-like enzyme